MTDEPLAVVQNWDDIRVGLRKAQELRGLSNDDLADLAGLTRGHPDKILGPSATKNFGPMSFDTLLSTLGVKLIMVLDPETEKLLGDRWKARQRNMNHVRTTPARVGKAVLERAKPVLLKQFGEKLAAVFGEDLGQILVGMNPPERSDHSTTSIPDRAA